MNQVLVPIALFIVTFAAIFVLRYLYHKEKMAMIERGMCFSDSYAKQKTVFSALRLGLLLIGVGMGLFIAYILDYFVFIKSSDNAAIYFSLITLFGGLGLFISYNLEKKEEGK